MDEETKDTAMPNGQAESCGSDLNASDNQDFEVTDAVVTMVVANEVAGGGNEDIDCSPTNQPTEFENRLLWLTSPMNLVRRPHERRSTSRTNPCWHWAARMCRCVSQRKNEPTSRHDDKQVRIPPRKELGLKGLAHASGEAISAASNWLQRRTFVAVVGLFLLFYLTAVILFSCILTIAINLAFSKRGMMCCTGYDFDSNTSSNNYVIVFELSWTVSDSQQPKQCV